MNLEKETLSELRETGESVQSFQHGSGAWAGGTL